MPIPIMNLREGKHLNQIFLPFKAVDLTSGAIGASMENGTILVGGLMRNARVKANGDQVVYALNLAHALGWAQSRAEMRISAALASLYFEVFEITHTAAEIGATLTCDRLSINSNALIKDDPDAFIQIVRDHQRHPLSIWSDLSSAIMLDK